MAITRLNNNSITSVTALPSGIDTGKVLQVKQLTKTDSSTYTLATDTLATFWTQTITPSSTSNKILASFVVYFGQQSVSAQPYIVLRRNGSDIFRADNIGSRKSSTASPGYGRNDTTLIATQWYLDSPSSTSSVSYTLNLGGYSSRTFYINIPDVNGDYVASTTSTFTLMEIAG
jgi:hypothetical protein